MKLSELKQLIREVLREDDVSQNDHGGKSASEHNALSSKPYTTAYIEDIKPNQAYRIYEQLCKEYPQIRKDHTKFSFYKLIK